jgi:hypothetical protein
MVREEELYSPILLRYLLFTAIEKRTKQPALVRINDQNVTVIGGLQGHLNDMIHYFIKVCL